MKHRLLLLAVFAALLLSVSGCGEVKPVMSEADAASLSEAANEFAADATVTLTLPDAEPVELSDEDAETVLELLRNAPLTEDHLVASVYLGEAVVSGETEVPCLFYEGEDRQLVIALPGGRLKTSDPDAFNDILSGEAFQSRYAASAPVRLLCSGEDYSAGLTAKGELLKTMPNGTACRSPVESEGDGTLLTVDSLNARPVLEFEVAPTEAMVKVTSGDESLFEGELSAFSDFLPAVNGTYDVTVMAAWKDGGRTGFDGFCTYTFKVEYALPFTVQAIQTHVVQGQPIILYLRNADMEELEVNAIGIKYDPYYAQVGDFRALIYPTHYNTAAGNGSISIGYGDQTLSIPFSIQKYDFQVQELTISEELSDSTVNNDTANYVYNQTATAINREVDQGVLYFTEPFLQPAEGEITAEFGMKRYVNGKAQSTHAGVDWAAEENSPVAAANAGRVVFADELQLTGNTVVLEHGGGIKTWYFHMNELAVEEGQMIARGDTLGLVGSTGFSTGPHLHFAVTIDGIYVSPWYVIGERLVDVNDRSGGVDMPVEEEAEEGDASEESEASESADE